MRGLVVVKWVILIFFENVFLALVATVATFDGRLRVLDVLPESP